jgi:hypothetical protein
MALGDDAALMGLEATKKTIDILEKILNFFKNGNAKQPKQNEKIDKVTKAARDSNSPILQQSGLSKTDAKLIEKRCKEQNIPVIFKHKIGSEFCTAIYAGVHKNAFENVMSGVVGERLAEKPNDLKQFTIREQDVSGIKNLCEQNGAEVNFTKSDDGTIKCCYLAKDKEILDVVKSDYKAIAADVKLNVQCGISTQNNAFAIRDTSLNMTIQFPKAMPQATIERYLKEQFDYSPEKARQVSVKFGNTLQPKEKQIFNTDSRQKELLANLDKKLNFPNENVRLKPYEFTRIRFKSDNLDRFIITNKDGISANLIPAKMSRKEIESTVASVLSITNPETVKLISDKLQKLDKEVKKQIKTDKKAEIPRQNSQDFSQQNQSAQHQNSQSFLQQNQIAQSQNSQDFSQQNQSSQQQNPQDFSQQNQSAQHQNSQDFSQQNQSAQHQNPQDFSQQNQSSQQQNPQDFSQQNQLMQSQNSQDFSQQNQTAQHQNSQSFSQQNLSAQHQNSQSFSQQNQSSQHQNPQSFSQQNYEFPEPPPDFQNNEPPSKFELNLDEKQKNIAQETQKIGDKNDGLKSQNIQKQVLSQNNQPIHKTKVKR